MFEVGSAVGYLLLDTSGWKNGLKTAREGLRTFEDQTATAADRFTAAGVALGSVGKTLTLGVTTPLVGLGAAAVSVGNEFEAQMSRVAAIAGAEGEELKALNDLALQLGAETAFSASEAAQGMENLASAGFTTQEIMDSLPGVLDLAASSGTDLATATEIAASAVRGFGLEADKTGHVADVFAEAAARTNAQTEDMGEAMKYIAPVAAAMSQSLEETAAAIGIMSDAGIKGSQAGTTLRGAFSRLAKPTEKMYEVMDDLGLSFYDAAGNMLPLNGIIEQLETNMGGLTQEQRNQALVTLFGQESLSGMLALMERGSGELLELTKSFESVEGSAAAMAEVMLDNTKGAIEEMFGSLETLGIKVQQVLAPVITEVVQGFTGLVNWLTSLDDTSLKLLVTLAGIIAALGPVLVIVGKLSTSIGGLIALITKAGGASAVFGQAFTLLTGPIGIAIAAIAALSVAWATNFAGIRDTTVALLGAIKEALSLFFTAISTLFQAFLAVFKGDWDNAWNLLKESASLAWEAIKSLFSSFLNAIVDTLIRIGVRLLYAAKSVFGKVREGFQTIWAETIAWFSSVVDDPVKAVTDLAEAMYEAGASIFNHLWDGLKHVWDQITSWVSNSISWIAEKVQFWHNESAKLDERYNSERGSDGSYASGLDYVPRDMNVRVHEGERILTKEENRVGSEGHSGGDTFNFYSPVALTPTKAAKEMKRAKQELALGFM